MNRRATWIALIALCSVGDVSCWPGRSLQLFTQLSVSIFTPPRTMKVGTIANIAATVFNDPTNGGVIWNCTPAASCGTSSFNPDSTFSEAVTNLTAPASIPAGGTITVTATTKATPSVSASATITITAVGNTQNYSFYVTGVALNDDGHDPYDIAGVIAVATDGTGDIVGGEQDYSDGNSIASPEPQGDAILGGNLSGGSLTLITNNANIGVIGVETFAVAFSNDDHAFISEFDGIATSSGSLDLQTST